MTNKVTTPEGDVADVSLNYTLSKEGEGDNISGNKELREEKEHEDENNSKRHKGSKRTVSTSTHHRRNRTQANHITCPRARPQSSR